MSTKTITQNSSIEQQNTKARRGFLSLGLGMGAAAAAFMAVPGRAQAEESADDSAVFTAREFGAVGDGSTNDYAALQQAIDAACNYQAANEHHRVILDLEGLTYRFNSPLYVYDKLTIQNGCLHASTGSNAVAISAIASNSSYAQLSCVNVKFRKLQYANVIGLQITDGLRCVFDRCQFENFRNGNDRSIALVLEGVQVASFVSCVWNENDTHVHFKQSSRGMPSTDCRFIACAFVESRKIGVTSEASSSGVAAASATFHGCNLESCTGGSLVDLVDVRNFRFDCCRFEDAHASHPIVELSTVNETANSRFINCNFGGSGSKPSVQCDSGVTGLVLMTNTFPGGRTSLTASEGSYRAIANSGLDDA